MNEQEVTFDATGFYRKLTNKLINQKVTDYCLFVDELRDLLQQEVGITEEITTGVEKSIAHFKSAILPGAQVTPELIKETALVLGKLMISDSTSHLELQQYDITEKDWEVLKYQYGIKKIEDDTVAYVGGVARVIIRHIHNMPQNQEDIRKTLGDIDLVATDISQSEIIQTRYGAMHEGITFLSDFSLPTLALHMQKIDLTMNQIVVLGNRCYYTKDALNDLTTGSTRLCFGGKGFYGIISYQKDGEVVYSATTLLRGIKFLVEGKVKSIMIAKHNIAKENLMHLEIERPIIVFFRRVLQSEESDEEKRLLFYRFALVLQGRGILDTPEHLFEYTDSLMKKHNFIVSTEKIDPLTNANRMLSKYIRLSLDKITGQDNDTGGLNKEYDSADQEMITLEVALENNPTPEFTKSYEDFMRKTIIGK